MSIPDLMRHVELPCVTVAIIDEDILRYERVKKKAYVRLVTTLGNLNLELHADMVIRCSCFMFRCLFEIGIGTLTLCVEVVA